MFRKFFGRREAQVMPNSELQIKRLEMLLDTLVTSRNIKQQAAPHEVQYFQDYVFLDKALEIMKREGAANVGALTPAAQRELYFVMFAVFSKDGKSQESIDWATPQEQNQVEIYREMMREKKRRRDEAYSVNSAPASDHLSVPDGKLLRWLKSQKRDPKLWHSIVQNAFRDGDRGAYEWIASQPECDTATALMIFHLFNSFESLEFADESAAAENKHALEFRIAKTICDRYHSGGFKTFDLPFVSMGYEADKSVYAKATEAARSKFGKAPFEVDDAFFEFLES
jgi:Domain of unknown function (DUF4274)